MSHKIKPKKYHGENVYIVIDNEGEGVIAQVTNFDSAVKIAKEQERKTRRNQTVAMEMDW
jgi:hypothetical protein